MIALFLKAYWKEIAVVTGVVLLLVALNQYDNYRLRKAYDRGYDACTSEYEEAAREHQENSTNENKKVERGYERVITKIIKVPSGCVSAADAASNKWLRENFKDTGE